MSREIPLTDERVREIMSKLKDEQRVFIQSTSKQSKKSKWLEVLARGKGIVFSDHSSLSQIIDTIDDWILQDVLDGGYGLRPYKCECGKPLRFQYIVHHTEQGTTYGLGETCFEHYTNLKPEILKEIKNGFYHIDLERDQILVKFEQGDLFNLDPYLHLEVPEAIQKQAALELPLTDKQISIITKLMEEHKLSIRKSVIVKNSIQRYRYSDDYTTRNSTGIDYETLLRKHLVVLRQVRSKEQHIPKGLLKDWDTIQQIVRDAKAKRPIDYCRFLVLLSNLLIPLGIKHDVFE